MSVERGRSARERRTATRAAGLRPLDQNDIAALEACIDAESAARRTYHALRELPPGTRALLKLIAVDGFSVTEAAYQGDRDVKPEKLTY